MKYKVGDRVKIKDGLKEGCGCCNYVTEDMEKYAGKVMTIRAVLGKTYHMKEDNGEYCGDGWYWTEDMIEGLATFTKSDLKDGDILTYRNEDKRTYVGGKLIDEEGNSVGDINNCNEDLTRENRFYEDLDIIKVERPTGYKTVFERKEEILDEAEKRYLRGVIRPFRDTVNFIEKSIDVNRGNFIEIGIKDDSNIMFPYFKNAMYEGMETCKKYTIEELGL